MFKWWNVAGAIEELKDFRQFYIKVYPVLCHLFIFATGAGISCHALTNTCLLNTRHGNKKYKLLKTSFHPLLIRILRCAGMKRTHRANVNWNKRWRRFRDCLFNFTIYVDWYTANALFLKNRNAHTEAIVTSQSKIDQSKFADCFWLFYALLICSSINWWASSFHFCDFIKHHSLIIEIDLYQVLMWRLYGLCENILLLWCHTQCVQDN